MKMNTTSGNAPGFFRFVFGTIFQGALLGIGFLAVFQIHQHIDAGSAQGDDYADIAPSRDAYLFSEKDYRLADLREVHENDGVWIVGRIDNLRKDRPIRGIELQANLYKGKSFVDQYSESILGGLKPGESRLFKINCGCKGSMPANHDRFEVVVVRAY